MKNLSAKLLLFALMLMASGVIVLTVFDPYSLGSTIKENLPLSFGGKVEKAPGKGNSHPLINGKPVKADNDADCTGCHRFLP